MNKPEIIDLSKAVTETLRLKELNEKKCFADVLRLDKIHPVISGNKWFKLKYHLEQALELGYKKILTFGGAYSSHILATACAAGEMGLEATGVIRGERAPELSYTLVAAQQYGMQLEFISREDYKNKSELDRLREDTYIIPEGGGGLTGIKGAEEILGMTDAQKYSHIICAIGTGTMFMGLVNASLPGQQVIGIPVLKGFFNLFEEFGSSVENPEKLQECKIFYDYHFGGYASKTPELFDFMNNFFQETGIPTDFVYTGKLMFAFLDLLKSDYFPEDSNILVIHSGGLQGNLSLPEGSLDF